MSSSSKTIWANARPPTIFPDSQFTNILSSKKSVFMVPPAILEPPVYDTDAVNKQYVDSHTSGYPGLPLNSVQYNEAGSFTGSADFLWNNTLKTLTINGDVLAQNLLSVSDVTLKSNITPLDSDNSLELLSKIECYKYNLLDSNTQTYGVMAQQLENIGLDNIVNQGQNYKSVAYVQLIPIIISGMKKLSEQSKPQNYVPFKPYSPK